MHAGSLPPKREGEAVLFLHGLAFIRMWLPMYAVYQQVRPGAVDTDAFYEMPRRISAGVEKRF